MFAEGAHLEYPINTKKHEFCIDPFKDHLCNVCFRLVNWCQSRNFHTLFLIASYDKTMSADGGHLEFPIGTKSITLVEVHSMIIHAMFALNWFTGFGGEIFSTFSHRVLC